jgi:hypothetical protein
MRGGTDDNDMWMKTFGMSHALLSLVYAQNNTAQCYCGRCYVEKSGWQENFILTVQLGALAYGNLEIGKENFPPMIS